MTELEFKKLLKVSELSSLGSFMRYCYLNGYKFTLHDNRNRMNYIDSYALNLIDVYTLHSQRILYISLDYPNDLKIIILHKDFKKLSNLIATK